MNKHLINIVLEYNFYQLKYEKELINTTSKLYQATNKSWFYHKLFIVSENVENIKKNYKMRADIKYKNMGNSTWVIAFLKWIVNI